MHEADRKYLEGWQHALMAIRSKYYTFASDSFYLTKWAYTHKELALTNYLDGLKSINMEDVGADEHPQQPNHAGNPFLG